MRDGILLIDKPAEHTSFDVIARLRGILHTRKLGHGGTLDPMATGVLPVFIGSATRLCDLLPNENKRYTAHFKLGVTTDSGDITGRVTRCCPADLPEAAVREALKAFRGPILQLPPMVSAVKVGGKRLYDLARRGIEVERKPRPVTLHTLELLAYDPERAEGVLDIACSKGTYIRTLVSDLGEKLGVGGTLTALRRTEACGFQLADCLTLETVIQLRDQNELDAKIRPVAEVFRELPQVRLNAHCTRLYCNGVRLRIEQADARLAPLADSGRMVAVSGADGRFLGVATVMTTETGIQLGSKKLFLERRETV